MTTKHHMCVDIQGALRNWSDNRNIGVWRDDDGKVLSPKEAKANLLAALAKGYRVLPAGDCEGFDYQTGCPGHDTPEAA